MCRGVTWRQAVSVTSLVCRVALIAGGRRPGLGAFQKPQPFMPSDQPIQEAVPLGSGQGDLWPKGRFSRRQQRLRAFEIADVTRMVKGAKHLFAERPGSAPTRQVALARVVRNTPLAHHPHHETALRIKITTTSGQFQEISGRFWADGPDTVKQQQPVNVERHQSDAALSRRSPDQSTRARPRAPGWPRLGVMSL